MFAVVEAYKAGSFSRSYWSRNIISGLIVGVVALPLAMAFAIASGVKPEQGIYTSIIAGIAVSLFGGSRVQIAGPTGAFIVLLASIVGQYGIAGLQTATFMAGIMLIFLGMAKLGSIIKYIPSPVINGFTTGIAVTIWIGQWPAFFGLTLAPTEHFHQKLLAVFNALPDLNAPTTIVGLISLCLVLLPLKMKMISRLPGPLLALVIMTSWQYLFGNSQIATIGSAFGGIPQQLPSFAVPDLSLTTMLSLIGPAFAIAMLGSIESLLSAVVADGMAGTKHNSNQELVGQGIANVLCPMFGGIAATGAIARTATNIRNGATNPLSGIVHALVLLLIVLCLAPLAQFIPLATLSAILFVVAWNMSEVHHFIKITRFAPRADCIILIITFLLTVFADLVVAVNIGVILAILQFLRRMASSVEVKYNHNHDLQQELHRSEVVTLPQDVAVYSVEGPFFFAAVDTFEQALNRLNQPPRILVIRLKWVPFIDISGIEILEKLAHQVIAAGGSLYITGANPRVEQKLRKAKIITLIGEGNLYHSFEQLVDIISDRDNEIGQ